MKEKGRMSSKAIIRRNSCKGQKQSGSSPEFDKEPIDRDGSIISGTVSNTACGIVKGRVKLISINYEKFDETQIKINEMRKGDILVSRTTDPSLIQACKKASAIITDVGGMLSHAAITARELNIPGIIGTQIATKVLKDGDMVEVDAEKGVVRIIGQEKTQTGPPKMNISSSADG